uniref:(northern house mosquito) hypothetical protein n=1 Tax=Culex pipiens TaxID=7175 RepID=A0A8D8BXW4_CULPI
MTNRLKIDRRHPCLPSGPPYGPRKTTEQILAAAVPPPPMAVSKSITITTMTMTQLTRTRIHRIWRRRTRPPWKQSPASSIPPKTSCSRRAFSATWTANSKSSPCPTPRNPRPSARRARPGPAWTRAHAGSEANRSRVGVASGKSSPPERWRSARPTKR